jgi:hypothetical protein
MRTKVVFAILLGMIGGTLRSSPLSAGQVGIPGAGCKIVNINNVEAANTSFFGPNITNNSSSTLYVYCPVQLDASSSPRSLSAYGNSKSLQGTCVFYYETSATTFTSIVATPFTVGANRQVDFALPDFSISNGAFRCAMGPNGSYFYNVLVNTQF